MIYFGFFCFLILFGFLCNARILFSRHLLSTSTSSPAALWLWRPRKSKKRSITRRHFHSNPLSPLLPGQTWVTRLLGVSWLSCQLTPSIRRGHFDSQNIPSQYKSRKNKSSADFLSLKDQPETVSRFEDGSSPTTINIVADLSGRRNLIKPWRGSLSPTNSSYFFSSLERWSSDGWQGEIVDDQ